MNQIDQPTDKAEKALNDVIENKKTVVKLNGVNKSYKIGCPHKGTMRKITDIYVEDGNDDKISCQCAALLILNSFFKIKFFYWFLWRWFYYWKEYDDEILQPILAEGKKKLPLSQYLVNTMLVTGMKDTVMMMTKKEAARLIQAAQSGAAPTV